jgi:(p)ppGpp synthase/HD superfamily hydrolase
MPLLAPPSLYLGGEYVSPSSVGREQFLKIMAHGLSLDEERVSILESVYVDTKKWFEGKTRRTGCRYFEHPKAVALMGLLEFGDTSFEGAIARLGHDTSEDTFKNLSGLRANYGKRAAGIIGLVTNPVKTGDAEKDARAKRAHYLAIRQFPEAGKVKLPNP